MSDSRMLSSGIDDPTLASSEVKGLPDPVPGGLRSARRRPLLLTRLARHKLAVVGLVVLVVLMLLSFIGERFWTYDYAEYTDDLAGSPSWRHPLGTNDLGQDTLAQVLRGTQRSILISFSVGVSGTLVGTVWGAVAGYVGGLVDTIMMRLVDVVLMFPLIIIASLLGNQIGASANGWMLIALALSALSWPLVARVVRSSTLSLTKENFVLAARLNRASGLKILWRHLIPNMTGIITVSVSVLVALAILQEAAISYLGFGVKAPDTSLGLLIQQAQGSINTLPWTFYSPGIVVIMMGVSVSFLGDGLRDVFSSRDES